MRAVDAVMECLKAEGVDVVFGLPGGANLPTYDAFVTGGLRHILVRHEAGGGHAAEGYAKATGKVGVAFATSGPGATNLITPITDAMMDSVPVVFITGQVRTELLGTDGFQEADTIGITMPIVKHSFMITRPEEIPRAIHEAFHIARSADARAPCSSTYRRTSRAPRSTTSPSPTSACPATSRASRATRSRFAKPRRRSPPRSAP